MSTRYSELTEPQAAWVRIPALGVERATVLVGPALILTSVVLACGLGVTVLSDLPSLRIFGWVSALAMTAALAADLLIPRPTITLLGRWRLAMMNHKNDILFCFGINSEYVRLQ